MGVDSERALGELSRASTKAEFAQAQEGVERLLRRLAVLEDCENFDIDAWNTLIATLRDTQDEVSRRCCAAVDAKCRYLYKRLDWNPELPNRGGYDQELSFPEALVWQQERGYRIPQVDEVVNLFFAVRDGAVDPSRIPKRQSSYWLDIVVESQYGGKRIFYLHPRGLVSGNYELVKGPNFCYDKKVEANLGRDGGTRSIETFPDAVCELLLGRKAKEIPRSEECMIYLHGYRDSGEGPGIEAMATNFFFNHEEIPIRMWLQATSKAYTKGVRLKDNKNP